MLLIVTMMIKYFSGARMTSNLAEDDGHEIVVEQERFGETWVVELEEEDGEAESDVLLRGCAER